MLSIELLRDMFMCLKLIILKLMIAIAVQFCYFFTSSRNNIMLMILLLLITSLLYMLFSYIAPPPISLTYKGNATARPATNHLQNNELT